MEDNQIMIPYIVVESMIARLERIITKLVAVIIVLIALFIATNLAWIYYENLFTDSVTTTTQEVTQDTDGGNNYVVGGDYGKANR